MKRVLTLTLLLLALGCHKSEAEILKEAAEMKKESLKTRGEVLTCLIKPNEARGWTWEAYEAPLKVYGDWTCEGTNFGGADDTIVKAKITDPAGKILQTWDHKASGKFSFTIDKPGKISFWFDNSGIIRSTKRQVVINIKVSD